VIASVSPEADRELTEAARFYARQGGREVGLAFISEYEKVIALLCASPGLGTVWRNNRRRFPLPRFPYSVVYYVSGEQLRIIALAHHRRLPEYWNSRR
jgi:plasmid stabilization system protein ParE